MSDLIQTLNKYATLTPDQIVTKLTGGWIRLGTITPEVHRRMWQQPAALVTYRRNGSFHVVQQPGYWNFWFDIHECHGYWRDFWICSQEDYSRDSQPDREA